MSAMNGQWQGTFTGSAGDGSILINVDDLQTHYRGVAYTHHNAPGLPSTAVFFRTNDKTEKFTFRATELYALDPASWEPCPWEKIQERFPNVVFSKYMDITGVLDEQGVSVSWVTDLGITGKCLLPRSKACEKSELASTKRNWNEFKAYASELKGKRYLFRGQGKPYRLRTSFHRRGRADVWRFRTEDIPALARHLSARTRHVFDFKDPDQFGAFMNLIQHHGYPTPLLDWTYSPYVAAFFAYREIPNAVAKEAQGDDRVRVFVFDQEQWRADLRQIQMLLFPAPHLSICEFLAIENERMIPQQAASTVTSIDDIESYIGQKAQETKKTYLTAIDLPVQERREVVHDLRYMGITAGSLFPGFDGACEELRDRNFEL
jgi:hypothetical protein